MDAVELDDEVQEIFCRAAMGFVVVGHAQRPWVREHSSPDAYLCVSFTSVTQQDPTRRSSHEALACRRLMGSGIS